MIDYLLVNLIVVLGPFVGLFLAMIAPEELKPGKKYFVSVFFLILSFVILTIIHSFVRFNQIILLILFLIIVLIITFLFFKNFMTNNKQLEKMIYPIFSFSPLLVFLSYVRNSYFFTIASLLFLLGFPVGTLLTIRFEKDEKLNVPFKTLFFNHVKKNSIFFAIILLMIILSLLFY